MDRHRHHGERRRPQHHHRLRRAPVLSGELGEEFRVAGVIEAGAIKHALGDRVGDDCASAAGGNIADGLPDRCDCSVGAGAVRLARLRRRNYSGGDDGQCIGECRARGIGVDVGKFDL